MKKIFVAVAALCLMAGWSCSKFDDSALNDRIDDIEGRVDGLESELEAIRSRIEGLNNAYQALTKVLNGGWITNVTEQEDGYLITVVYSDADGTVSTRQYKIKHGTKGDAGERGEDGQAPALTVKADEDGALYWVIIDPDGTERDLLDADGNRVYATGPKGDAGDEGAQGDKGERGVTPFLAVAPDNGDGAPDLTADDIDDDTVLYWWVSYNYNDIDDKSEAAWEKLATANSAVTADMSLTAEVDEETGELVFYVNGQEICRTAVAASNPLSVAFTIGGEAVEPYTELSMSVDETVEIAVKVEGASDNAALKASLQNADGSYELKVKGMVVAVTAKELNAENKLLVEVLDGPNNYSAWLDLKTEGLYSVYATVKARLDVDEEWYHVANIGTLPDYDNFGITIELNKAAAKDLVFDVAKFDTGFNAAAGAMTFPETVTVKAGESSVVIPVSLKRSAIPEGDYLEEGLVISTEDECDIRDEGIVLFNIDCEAQQVKLTVDNLSTKKEWCASGLESLKYLVDGEENEIYTKDENGKDVTTNNFWESVWGTSNLDDTLETSEYGVYIAVNLPEGEPVVAASISHKPRHSGVAPTAVTYVELVDNEANILGEETYEADGNWRNGKVYPISEGATEIHFGVTECPQSVQHSCKMAPYLTAFDGGYTDFFMYPCFGLLEIKLNVLY